eukprot:TRINITY_DN12046_c0_g1_i3.p1 TRINITY_DN12046_c0_g1~~TRINITY_DN12046_c0_g1_i3.p1  ORF type:complete len:699 (-),score=136.28 TRINITY_DN12046_c0_g1_i3:24-2120(-)
MQSGFGQHVSGRHHFKHLQQLSFDEPERARYWQGLRAGGGAYRFNHADGVVEVCRGDPPVHDPESPTFVGCAIVHHGTSHAGVPLPPPLPPSVAWLPECSSSGMRIPVSSSVGQGTTGTSACCSDILPDTCEIGEIGLWIQYRLPLSEPVAVDMKWASYPHLLHLENWRKLMRPRVEEFENYLLQRGVPWIECEVCKSLGCGTRGFAEHVSGVKHFKNLWQVLPMKLRGSLWHSVHLAEGSVRFNHLDGVIEMRRGRFDTLDVAPPPVFDTAGNGSVFSDVNVPNGVGTPPPPAATGPLVPSRPPPPPTTNRAQAIAATPPSFIIQSMAPPPPPGPTPLPLPPPPPPPLLANISDGQELGKELQGDACARFNHLDRVFENRRVLESPRVPPNAAFSGDGCSPMPSDMNVPNDSRTPPLEATKQLAPLLSTSLPRTNPAPLPCLAPTIAAVTQSSSLNQSMTLPPPPPPSPPSSPLPPPPCSLADTFDETVLDTEMHRGSAKVGRSAEVDITMIAGPSDIRCATRQGVDHERQLAASNGVAYSTSPLEFTISAAHRQNGLRYANSDASNATEEEPEKPPSLPSIDPGEDRRLADQPEVCPYRGESPRIVQAQQSRLKVAAQVPSPLHWTKTTVGKEIMWQRSDGEIWVLGKALTELKTSEGCFLQCGSIVFRDDGQDLRPLPDEGAVKHLEEKRIRRLI